VDQDQIVAVIEEATSLRGWISNSYAQVEYLLGDLIMRCRQFPEYGEFTATISHSAVKRVSKVRSMLKIAGPLTPFVGHLSEVLDAFDLNHDVRNLLAHGFCEFHFTPDGDAGLYFRKFDRGDVGADQDPDILVERVFRLIDMQYHREQFTFQAQRALEVFAKVHFDLGWGNLDPDKLVNGWLHPL
jgi:hypothetical protein